METVKIEINSKIGPENLIVRDHRVHDIKILPGVTFLDMILRALIEDGLDVSSLELLDITFLEPIAVSEEFYKELKITVTQGEEGIRVYAHSSKHFFQADLQEKQEEPAQAVSDLNLKCRLNRREAAQQKSLDIDFLKQQALQKTDLDAVYAMARKVGITHDSYMKGLGEVYEGQDWLLCALHLSDLAMQDAQHFYLHPAFLDASTIVPFKIFLEGKEHENKAFIPLHIASFQSYRRITDQCYVYVDKQKIGISANKDVVYLDIEIYNEKGQVCAVFHQLAGKQIRSDALITQLVKKELRTTMSPQSQEAPAGNPLMQLSRTRDVSLREFIQLDLAHMIAQVQNKAVQEVSMTDGFYDQGLDSVQLLEMVNALGEKLGQELYPTLLFEYSNIQDFAGYLEENYREIYAALQGAGEKLQTHAMLSQDTAILTEEKQELRAPSSVRGTDIAIIGVAGRYPMAQDVDAFWENLKTGKDCITEIPPERWDHEAYYSEDKTKIGTTYGKWGGFIDDVDKFDPMFFNISPRDAQYMDPQERLFLETAWETLENAGYTRESLSPCKTGVFVGVMWGQYQLFGDAVEGRRISPTATYASIANRVSYTMNFKGPSMALDTMCSSSLTAIHLACESIRSGDCDVALAGGVNVSIHPNKYVFLGQHKFLSSDGKCKSFAEGGDGYVPGEGVGAVLLKPLANAVADGDSICAIIKGSVINHGGKAGGFSVPNPAAQAELITEAFHKSGVEPRSISYIEAHGTGTALGDPIEIQGLQRAFAQQTQDKQFCAIGSVKSNIGHLEAAAGIAGITKVLLQMRHKQLVPSLHGQTTNSKILFEQSPFYLQQNLSDWSHTAGSQTEQSRMPRRAGLSSFGAGGSNAHILLEEYPGDVPPGHASETPQLILLSAKNEERLHVYVQKLLVFLERAQKIGQEIPLEAMAFTLQVGREAFDQRVALIVSSVTGLLSVLKRVEAKETDLAQVYFGNIRMEGGLASVLGATKDEKIAAYLKARDLEALAKAWVSGAKVDWRALYHAGRPQRMPLPTYPFLRRSYWLKAFDVPQTQVGTPYFICPEIYLKRPYSSTSDIWSLGGVLYNLAALHPPFLADKYVPFAALFSGVCAEVLW